MDDSFHSLLLMVKLLEEASTRAPPDWANSCSRSSRECILLKQEYRSQVNKDHLGIHSQKNYLQYVKTEVCTGRGKEEINTHIHCDYSHLFLHGRIFSPTGSNLKVKGFFHCRENESNTRVVAKMSIFVPFSTQKEQNLLDLIFTFTVTLLSLPLNWE